MKMPVNFHMGAHKTATTYIQSRLLANRDALNEAGICVVNLWARDELTAAYRAALSDAIEGVAVRSNSLARASVLLRSLMARSLSEIGREPTRVVVSFENAAGGYDLSRGPIYPNIAAGVSHVLEAFQDMDVRILFGVRSLDRLLESGYVQRLYSRFETRTFKGYLEEVDLDELSWIRVIDELENVVGAGHLTTWAYEDFPQIESTVWTAMLSERNWRSLLEGQAARSNPSLSRKGMKYIRSLNRVLDPADAPLVRRFIKRNFKRKSAAPFLLRDEQRCRLQARYANELSALRSRSHYV